MAGKPEIKVYFKAADGSGFADLCAFWRNDNGMLAGRLDKSVRAIKVVRKDGGELILRPDDRGIVEGWYLNTRTEAQAPPSGSQRGRGAGGRPATKPAPADDFPDDDIPF